MSVIQRIKLAPVVCAPGSASHPSTHSVLKGCFNYYGVLGAAVARSSPSDFAVGRTQIGCLGTKLSDKTTTH